MIELNHILLFLAIVSPIAVFARAWQHQMARSWHVAAFVVLGITLFSLLLFRRNAGFIGAGAWFALLFLPAVGLKRVAELSAWHRYAEARRLVSLLRFVHPGRDLREQAILFRDLERRQVRGQLPRPVIGSARGPLRHHLSGCWAITTMIVVNVIYFAFEGPSYLNPNSFVLSRLGALDIDLVVRGHEYWRLLTSLFLHYGPVHLLFNMFALYVIGPPLERTIGGVRFLFCYLVAGLGSTVGVVLLTILRHPAHPSQLVGASGCVMGIVGAIAGFLLRDRHIPETRARLQNILLIIGIQVLFDVSTPQVSMSAHLCGLATGFGLGLFL